jgi:cytochrome b-561
MGGLGVKAAPFTYVSHVLAVAAAVLVFVWCIHFRGGLAFESSNKNLIFNVVYRFFISLSFFFLLLILG